MFVLAALHLPTVNWKIPGLHTVLDFKEIVGIIGGVVVVILIVLLFLEHARTTGRAPTPARTRLAGRGVSKFLSSADPAERIAGIQVAATEGLEKHLRSLRHLSDEEKNPLVLKELAETVARHQWEPSDDVDAVELRVWAHRYYAERVGPHGRDTKPPVSLIEPKAPVAGAAPSVVTPPRPAVAVPTIAVPSTPTVPVPTVDVPPGSAEAVPTIAVPSSPAEAGPTISLPPSPGGSLAGLAEPETEGPFTVLDLERRWRARHEEVPDEKAPGSVEEPAEAVPELVEEPEETAFASIVVPEEAAFGSVEEPAETVPELVEEPVEAAPESVEVSEEAVPEWVVAERPCILVTGASGAAGVTLIRSLVAAGHRVVAVDSDPLAAGLRLAPTAQIIPSADDPQFATFLCKLAVHQCVKAIISTVAEELPSLADHHELFDEERIATWFPERGVVQACIDKWLFHLAAKSVSLPVPPTNLGSAEGIPGPWIVKPRFGGGSRENMWVDEPEDLDWALSHVPSPLVQSRLTGREFTVDALVSRDGSLAGAVPRWHFATRDGVAAEGETFKNEGLVRLVENLLKGLAVRGPANVQGFASREGNVMFTAVSPGFSGGLALSLAAGADLVGQFVNGVFDLPIDPERLRYRSGVRMLRYYDEIFEG